MEDPMSSDFVRPLVALHIPVSNKSFIAFARTVHDHMLGNAAFPSPTPALEVLDGDLSALEDAEIKAGTGAKGATSQRDAKKSKVKRHLFSLRGYVQTVADAQPSAAEAAAVIESAFMSVQKARSHTVPELVAKNNGVSGTVILDAKAVAATASYYWEYSLDQETWTSAPETLQSKTSISGLTPARLYYFRFRALTRTGALGYSQVVSLVVH
jgi:hypothetical protein